ncbi:aminotransferase class III-fold pyridoxal phosphate-dependent enzyme [Nocardiopsis sp. NPDC007018]|uniref:aminotransferase class III-fold pyridoxal phosphate-dependent enzyme n=1 Tax=Nocardiopsis sp. NPDC007018 TaxID=3155721 RepID=UPI0033E21628
MTQAMDVVDITTTAVGRDTIIDTYDSFFQQVSFSGAFRVLVTVDPAYSVAAEERERVHRFLKALPQTQARVHEVVVEEFPVQVGLQTALSVLFSHAMSPFGVHLEDDWLFTGPVDLDALIGELQAHDSTEIVLSNSHVAQGGTFTHEGEVEMVPDSPSGLLRLTPASWAKHYLPLCPHVHRTSKWAPTIARALALTDGLRCPDERVRERILMEGTTGRHNVLWTPAVVAEDIGRSWLAERGRHKAVTPRLAVHGLDEKVPLPRGDRPLPLQRSNALRKRALAVIPGMTQTYQKRPVHFAEGEYPVYAERGDGAVIWDVDGTPYVDFVLALGAATLGYNHPALTNAIRERAGRGTLLSLPSQSEISLSESLVDEIPEAEMVRFLKTGAEACSAAVRLARHKTGRDRVLLIGYHGWHDQLGGRGGGIPRATAALSERRELDGPYDSRLLEYLRRGQGEQLAAVVLSSPYDTVLERRFLHELRAICDEQGCLLVLDEIVTGFRLAPGGLGHLHGVRADLTCLSKGLAAGMPLAALLGPRAIMAEMAELSVSTTFGGELLSIEAARVALREYSKDDYYGRIANLGARLRDGINLHARELGLGAVVVGHDAMPCLRFSPDPALHAARSQRFQARMAEHGYLFRRDVNFISAAHTGEQIESAVDAARTALRDYREERGR